MAVKTHDLQRVEMRNDLWKEFNNIQRCRDSQMTRRIRECNMEKYSRVTPLDDQTSELANVESVCQLRRHCPRKKMIASRR